MLLFLGSAVHKLIFFHFMDVNPGMTDKKEHVILLKVHSDGRRLKIDTHTHTYTHAYT